MISQASSVAKTKVLAMEVKSIDLQRLLHIISAAPSGDGLPVQPMNLFRGPCMADSLPIALRFRQLCEQAAKETDPKRLLELTQAIGRIFDEREKAKQP
jgi:hypothetical protein